MLKIIWSFFFLSAFGAALWQSGCGNWQIWSELVGAMFASAKSAFTIALNLTGLLCLWLGLLKIAECSGITEALAKLLRPLFKRIMPEVPADSPAIGSMVMNIAANVLGLDNAATPMGIKAMKALDDGSGIANFSMIMLVVVNATSIQLLPSTVIGLRENAGSQNSADIILPTILATIVTVSVGISLVLIFDKIKRHFARRKK